jgi:hypothetical protein
MHNRSSSIFKILISFLIARWLWDRYSNNRNETPSFTNDETVMMIDALKDTNEYWDSL